MFLKNFLFLTLVCSTLSSYAQELNQVLSDSEKLLVNTNQYVIYNKQVEAGEKSKLHLKQEQNWTLETTLSDTVKSSDPDISASELRRLNSLSFTQSAQFQNRSGFEGQLSVSANQFKYQDIGLPEQNSNSLVASAQIAYDVFKGGNQSASHNQVKINTLTVNKSLYDYKSEYNDFAAKQNDLVIDYYFNLCKYKTLLSQKTGINDIIKTGEIQLKAKILSYRDYLNFLDLNNSMIRRISQIENTRDEILTQSLSYSKELQIYLSKIDVNKISCNLNEEKYLNSKYEKRQSNLLSIKQKPLVLGLDLQKEIIDLKIKNNTLSYKSSLKPFLQIDVEREEFKDGSFVNSTIGLQYSIELANGLDNLGLQSLVSEKRVVELNQNKILREYENLYEQYITQLKVQQKLIPVIKSSIKNLDEILKTLDLQRKIGQVDSFNYASSKLSRIDAEHSLFDSFSTIEKTQKNIEVLVSTK